MQVCAYSGPLRNNSNNIALADKSPHLYHRFVRCADMLGQEYPDITGGDWLRLQRRFDVIFPQSQPVEQPFSGNQAMLPVRTGSPGFGIMGIFETGLTKLPLEFGINTTW